MRRTRRSLPTLALLLPLFSTVASASPSLEGQLTQLFVGRSFTIRNFYRGGHLHYGSDGKLLDKADPGFWSRDGMVQFSSVKLSKGGALIMEGNRYCVQFEPENGEFVNVRTGDKVALEIQLRPDQASLEALIPVLQTVLLSQRDRLADLVPTYWTNCLARSVFRKDKHSLWECDAKDGVRAPDFEAKNVVWDLPPPDNSLHTGRTRYLLQRRVAYLSGPGLKAPTLLGAADPFFDWLQQRTSVGDMTLVLSFTVGEDGTPHDVLIVSPVGMGVDDEAAQAVSKWKFKPGSYGGTPCPVHARVFFDIRPTNTNRF
jgi:TonB family protein